MAYRSLTRPSSVLSAKASTIRPYKQPNTTRCSHARKTKSRITRQHIITQNSHKTINTNSKTEFSRNHNNNTTTPQQSSHVLARVHYPVLKPPTTPHHTQPNTLSAESCIAWMEPKPPTLSTQDRGSSGTQKHAIPPDHKHHSIHGIESHLIFPHQHPKPSQSKRSEEPTSGVHTEHNRVLHSP